MVVLFDVVKWRYYGVTAKITILIKAKFFRADRKSLKIWSYKDTE